MGLNTMESWVVVLTLPVRQCIIFGTSVNFCFSIYPVSVQVCVLDNKLLNTGSLCIVNYYSRVVLETSTSYRPVGFVRPF